MKTVHIALINIAILLLVSCKKEVEKPKVIYSTNNNDKSITKLIRLRFPLLIYQFRWRERII